MLKLQSQPIKQQTINFLGWAVGRLDGWAVGRLGGWAVGRLGKVITIYLPIVN